MGERTSGAKRLRGRNDQGGNDQGGKRLGGETTRGGNGFGAKCPGFQSCNNDVNPLDAL